MHLKLRTEIKVFVFLVHFHFFPLIFLVFRDGDRVAEERGRITRDEDEDVAPDFNANITRGHGQNDRGPVLASF